MSRSILTVVVFGLILVAGPLRGHNLTEAAKPTDLPDAALPEDLDRVLRDFEQAWRADDTKALASLFTADGFVLQSNRKPVRGRLAIEAAYKGQGGGPLKLRALAFVAGDTAGYIIGAYRYGDATSDAGKVTLTLHRAPGQPWLIFSDMDNANQSPKPRPASGTVPPATPQPAEH